MTKVLFVCHGTLNRVVKSLKHQALRDILIVDLHLACTLKKPIIRTPIQQKLQ